MITRLHWISAVATALSFAAAADAAEPIFVQIPALFDPRAPVNDAVRRECGLDGLLGNDVFEQVKATFPDSTALQKPAGTEREKVLRVTILSVSAQGGGLWSGGKSITVRADLVQSGKIIATTVKERGSRGGAFGQFRGTCGILERVTAALGKDIATWVSQMLLSSDVQQSAATAEPQKAIESEQAPAPGKTD